MGPNLGVRGLSRCRVSLDGAGILDRIDMISGLQDWEPSALMTRIRPATPDDEPALSRIYNEVRRAQFPWVDAAGISEGDFKRDSEDEEVFVEELDGVVLGFIAIWVPDSFVHHLFVALEHQGRGTGGRLLEFAQRRYAWPLHLKCVEANERALAFYKKRGGVVLDRGTSHEGEYLLMEMPLLDAEA